MGHEATAVDRALTLLRMVVEDGGRSPLAVHAAAIGVPLSTAYRMTEILRRHGLLTQVHRGRHAAGLGLCQLGAFADQRTTLIAVARPLVRRLAREARATCHLGVLENEMVTYIVKEQGGRAALFTQEGGQLEAYCSAIGRVLLASLPESERRLYLAGGPFVSLTPRTITDPEQLDRLFQAVQSDGFATDPGEVAEDLHCIAVPVRTSDGRVIAALSLSRSGRSTLFPSPSMLKCADGISRRLATGLPGAQSDRHVSR